MGWSLGAIMGTILAVLMLVILVVAMLCSHVFLRERLAREAEMAKNAEFYSQFPPPPPNESKNNSTHRLAAVSSSSHLNPSQHQSPTHSYNDDARSTRSTRIVDTSDSDGYPKVFLSQIQPVASAGDPVEIEQEFHDTNWRSRQRGASGGSKTIQVPYEYVHQPQKQPQVYVLQPAAPLLGSAVPYSPPRPTHPSVAASPRSPNYPLQFPRHHSSAIPATVYYPAQNSPQHQHQLQQQQQPHQSQQYSQQFDNINNNHKYNHDNRPRLTSSPLPMTAAAMAQANNTHLHNDSPVQRPTAVATRTTIDLRNPGHPVVIRESRTTVAYDNIHPNQSIHHQSTSPVISTAAHMGHGRNNSNTALPSAFNANAAAAHQQAVSNVMNASSAASTPTPTLVLPPKSRKRSMQSLPSLVSPASASPTTFMSSPIGASQVHEDNSNNLQGSRGQKQSTVTFATAPVTMQQQHQLYNNHHNSGNKTPNHHSYHGSPTLSSSLSVLTSPSSPLSSSPLASLPSSPKSRGQKIDTAAIALIQQQGAFPVPPLTSPSFSPNMSSPSRSNSRSTRKVSTGSQQQVQYAVASGDNVVAEAGQQHQPEQTQQQHQHQHQEQQVHVQPSLAAPSSDPLFANGVNNNPGTTNASAATNNNRKLPVVTTIATNNPTLAATTTSPSFFPKTPKSPTTAPKSILVVRSSTTPPTSPTTHSRTNSANNLAIINNNYNTTHQHNGNGLVQVPSVPSSALPTPVLLNVAPNSPMPSSLDPK